VSTDRRDDGCLTTNAEAARSTAEDWTPETQDELTHTEQSQHHFHRVYSRHLQSATPACAVLAHISK